MNYLKNLGLALTACTTLACASLASAMPMFYFDATPEVGMVGDTISVDLMYDGSGTSPTYLADWDFEILFDDTIVEFSSAAFGFGVDSFGLGITDVFPVTGGIGAYEISLDFASDLIDNQDLLGNVFPILTIDFTALADGETDLVISPLTFGDELGNPFQASFTDGLICIGANGCAPVVDVPVPMTAWLLGLGIAGLVLRSRIQR